jgi:hypothetical protein
MAHRILRFPAVRSKTGIPHSTLYQLIADGKFPKQFSITVLRSSAIVALTWTQRFTIASSSDSSLHAGRSSRLRVLSSPHRERINNREKLLDKKALTGSNRNYFVHAFVSATLIELLELGQNRSMPLFSV